MLKSHYLVLHGNKKLLICSLLLCNLMRGHDFYIDVLFLSYTMIWMLVKLEMKNLCKFV